MSFVLQVGKLWRTTGRRALLENFWPALVRGMEHLASLAPAGVPEGGTTYDIWDFPSAFIYTATLYLATLATMIDLCAAADPALASRYQERHAGFWAMLDHDPRTGATAVEIVRTFGVPVVVERVVQRGPLGGERVVALGPTALVSGLRLRLALGGADRLLGPA